MHSAMRILLPGITAGLVIVFSGTAAYLYHTIEPIPEIPESFLAAYPANAPALPEADSAPSAEADLFAQEHLPDTAYLVRLQDDTLYVFAEGSREPDAVYPLPAEWLPDYDRTLLEYGMRVSNAAELREIIEDYIS